MKTIIPFMAACLLAAGAASSCGSCADPTGSLPRTEASEQLDKAVTDYLRRIERRKKFESQGQ